MSKTSVLKDSLLIPAFYSGIRITAANAYGDYEITDAIDAVAANAEIIITIIAEKIASKALEYAAPRFNPIHRVCNSRNRVLFYISAGIAASALATTAVYPIRIFRARRKNQKAAESTAIGRPVAVVEINTQREDKATLFGGFLCLAVNSVPDYAKGHSTKLALFAIVSSFAIVNSSIIGGYKKLIRNVLPESLP